VFIGAGAENTIKVEECCIIMVQIGSDVFAVAAKSLGDIKILVDSFGLLSTEDVSARYYISNTSRNNTVTIKNNMTRGATVRIIYIGLSRDIY